MKAKCTAPNPAYRPPVGNPTADVIIKLKRGETVTIPRDVYDRLLRACTILEMIFKAADSVPYDSDLKNVVNAAKETMPDIGMAGKTEITVKSEVAEDA